MEMIKWNKINVEMIKLNKNNLKSVSHMFTECFMVSLSFYLFIFFISHLIKVK